MFNTSFGLTNKEKLYEQVLYQNGWLLHRSEYVPSLFKYSLLNDISRNDPRNGKVHSYNVINSWE